MIKLHKYGPAFGLPDPSPFVCKVETYLRLVGQPYEAVSGDVRKAPRRQLPVAEIDGVLVPDSARIIEAIESRRPQRMDAHLDAQTRAVAVAFQAMLEAELYFGMLFFRWACDDGWAVFEPGLRDMLGRMRIPSVVRGAIARSARKYTVTRTKAQGIGRRPRAEVVSICSEIIDAVTVQLGDKPYICGDRPTTYDATVYAFSLGVLCPAFDNELRRHTAAKNNLGAYVERIRSTAWADGA
jgi:glutathione S-transferase